MRSKRLTKKYDFAGIEIFELFQQGNDFNLLKSFLDTHGGINATDESGRTALIECINNYSNPIKKIPFANDYAKELVKLGIDINKKDLNGKVALHFCVSAKNYEMLDFLLATPNIDIHTQPDLLYFAFNRDFTNSSLIIKLLKLGLDPFEKKYSGLSFYDILEQFDKGIMIKGNGKVDVKPILDFINSNPLLNAD